MAPETDFGNAGWKPKSKKAQGQCINEYAVPWMVSVVYHLALLPNAANILKFSTERHKSSPARASAGSASHVKAGHSTQKVLLVFSTFEKACLYPAATESLRRVLLPGCYDDYYFYCYQFFCHDYIRRLHHHHHHHCVEGGEARGKSWSSRAAGRLEDCARP